MKKLINICFVCVSALIGCAHQPETSSKMTSEQREMACQTAQRDKALFCDETSVSRTFRDVKCIGAENKIKEYCGRESAE